MFKKIFIAATCTMLFHTSAGALSVVPMELDEVIDRAATAFEGTVLETRSEIELGTRLIVTYTTFSIKDSLKGTLPATYTIKQVGGAKIPGGLQFPSVTYTVGQSYVVFLAGVSAAGFTSPIGFTHGKFDVQGEGANRRVSNGKVLRVPKKLDASVAEGGELEAKAQFEVDDFKSRVRARVSRVAREQERLK